MQVELLGTGGYYANEQRQTACTFFASEGLVIDAGSGLFRIADRIQTPELHLFLSHAHLDHIVGLPFLLLPLIRKQIQKLTIYAAPETHTAINTHLLSTALFPVSIPYESVQLANSGQIRINPATTVEWQRLPSHPGGSMGFRVESQQQSRTISVGLITDTVVDQTYNDLIRNVDLLFHECNFPDEQTELANLTGHSHSTPVAELARDVGAKRLVTVHFDPSSTLSDPIGLASMQAIFPNTEIGYDKQRFDLS